MTRRKPRKRRSISVIFSMPGSIIHSAGLVKVYFYSVKCENKVANGPWDKQLRWVRAKS
jgi:hypothetical protein